VLSLKKLVLSPVLQVVLIAATAVFATANFADGSAAAGFQAQPVQLAQLTAGFDAEQKYMMSCFACHSSGAAGAPKVGAGNVGEWTPRMEKGMDAVVTNAINGLNTMPPKGLCFDCTDDDLRAIVEYMVASSTE
jgi:cytochrome c5